MNCTGDTAEEQGQLDNTTHVCGTTTSKLVAKSVCEDGVALQQRRRQVERKCVGMTAGRQTCMTRSMEDLAFSKM
jgi:hypothetical protein